MSAKDKEKAAPAAKKVADKPEEKILGILPAPGGMNARFMRKDENDNPVESAKQVACLALVEDEDGDRKIRVVVLEELTGPTLEAGEFQFATI